MYCVIQRTSSVPPSLQNSLVEGHAQHDHAKLVNIRGFRVVKEPRAIEALQERYILSQALPFPLVGARGISKAAALRVHDTTGVDGPALLQSREDGGEADGDKPRATDAFRQDPQIPVLLRLGGRPWQAPDKMRGNAVGD